MYIPILLLCGQNILQKSKTALPLFLNVADNSPPGLGKSAIIDLLSTAFIAFPFGTPLPFLVKPSLEHHY
jgi:hypothetical protein